MIPRRGGEKYRLASGRGKYDYKRKHIITFNNCRSVLKYYNMTYRAKTSV